MKKRIDSRIIVITKLTPNVTDITLPARAAIEGGSDAISMINTLRAMAIDITTGIPYLGNKTGGLSFSNIFFSFFDLKKYFGNKKRKPSL